MTNGEAALNSLASSDLPRDGTMVDPRVSVNESSHGSQETLK